MRVCLIFSFSPFFGSDRCSMVSLPTSAKVSCQIVIIILIVTVLIFHCLQSAENIAKLMPSPESQLRVSHKYDSLERAVQKERMDSLISVSNRNNPLSKTNSRTWVGFQFCRTEMSECLHLSLSLSLSLPPSLPPPSLPPPSLPPPSLPPLPPPSPQSSAREDPSWDLSHGRVWCVTEDLPSSEVAASGLQREGEVVVTCKQEELDCVHVILSIINSVYRQWYDISRNTII